MITKNNKWILACVLIFLSVFHRTANSQDPIGATNQPKYEVSSGPYLKMVRAGLVGLGCESFRDRFFEGSQIYLLDTKSYPKLKQVQSALHIELDKKLSVRISTLERKSLEEQIFGFYRFLFEDVAKIYSSQRPSDLKRTLGALKIGDHSTEQARQLQPEIDRRLLELQKLSSTLGFRCESSGDREDNKVSNFEDLSGAQKRALQADISLPVFGLRRAMATAYQSCESLSLAPMTRKTAAIEGVEDAGAYPGGGGRLRKITDQAALARTHHYVKDYVGAPGCVDVKKMTMIYDYGGKPYVSSTPASPMSYWKNNDDGSSGLGIDCSGYVFTSIASAGLRLAKGKPLKATEAGDYNAAMYINPADNGFTCLEKAKMGRNLDLQPGDIAVTKYHIVMIASVGKDPLAIRKYSDCSQITYSDFDFVIAQSSPEQNAIGINKYNAKEYLAQKTFNPIQSGFVLYARAACEAYQGGVDKSAGSRSFAIVRHKMTPDCMQPEVALEGSSCIDSCKELYE